MKKKNVYLRNKNERFIWSKIELGSYRIGEMMKMKSKARKKDIKKILQIFSYRNVQMR